MSEAVGGLDLTTEPKLDHGDGDHDRFSHYVSREDAMKAYIEGVQVTALCGKKWVPSRDPEKFPICPTCKELYGLVFGDN
jgi:hypothetical protein